MANSNQNSTLDAFSETQSEEKPYEGAIRFNKKTISFNDTVILRQNIAQVLKYGVKRVNKISGALLVLSAIMVIVGFTKMPYTLILSLVFGFILYIGIKERTQPKLSGLTIELSSGSVHNFLSPDKKGIDDHFRLLSEALENGETFTLDFKGSKFNVTNITGHGNIIGDGNTIRDIKINENV